MKDIILLTLLIPLILAQKKTMPQSLEQQAIAALTQETQDVIKQYASFFKIKNKFQLGANATGLISNVSDQTGAEFWTCAKSDLNATLQGFPENIINQFNNVAFSASTEFESFSSYIQANCSYVYELVGTAKANSTDVAIGIAYVSVLGTTIQQYNVTKNCSTCWIVKTCCKNVSTPIGFTTPQQDQMVDYLTEVGYQDLLSDMPNMVNAKNMQMEFYHHHN